MTGTRAADAAVGVTLGRCDEMRAEVLVSAGTGSTITGTLEGPRRGRDTTLPATARLQPTATPGNARAILTEPAYWTPDLPNLYRLEATIEVSDRPPRSLDRLVGLRRLGVRGRSLWLDGRRWVPRGMHVAGGADIDACKPPVLAAVVAEPDDRTLDRADEIGVAVLALVTASSTDPPTTIADRIMAWSAHPSVVLAILPPDLPPDTLAKVLEDADSRRGTLLLAATVAGTAPPPPALPRGLDAIVVALEPEALPHDAWRPGTDVPLIAWRRGSAAAAAGRTPCDSLQAALASWMTQGAGGVAAWDWAGYIVG